MFIVGAALARKPSNILELGMGSGYLTGSLREALRYNQQGQLTSVDNWFDTGGTEPQIAVELRTAGVNVVCSGEEEFVRQAQTDAYDFLVSDADHHRSADWLDQHLRITRRDAFLFFHDTNQPDILPGLSSLAPRIAQQGLPYYHFRDNSRIGERCDRGLLFVINKK